MTGQNSQFIPVGATYYHVVPDGRGVEWIAKPKDGWEFLTPMATAMRAVNAHDALVAALERITRVAFVELVGKRDDVLEQARAALALAKGEKP